MFQSQDHGLDIEAISGIMGSVSIACWVVVFSPQIYENFRRSSAEGLSIEFVIIWLAGDFANIIGAVAQKVLPTMIILAIYYTFADIVLLGQCFYYRGFTFRDPNPLKESAADASAVQDGESTPTERSALLANGHSGHANASDVSPSRRRSVSAFRDRVSSFGEHLSPALPMHTASKSDSAADATADATTSTTPGKPRSKPRSILKRVLFNAITILVVIVAGIAGYYLSSSRTNSGGETFAQQTAILHFSPLGQAFGYLCALLYLGSRVPQLLLNHRRKSTEGLNALFFIFACIGNLTYVLSIFAFDPICRGERRGAECAHGERRAVYGRYILVNLSWLMGSLGTLFLDAGVFVQFFMYRQRDGEGLGEERAEDAPRAVNGEGRGRSPNER